MDKQVKIKNNLGEQLDALIEGNEKSKVTIVFVHGFGTDKNETENLFTDIATALKSQFRIIRFDLTGYGKSEGKQEETNYNKHAEDLKSVFDWVLIIHSLQDEIVGNEFMDKYRQIPKVKYIEINGDHSFKKKVDRKKLIETIHNYF